MVLWEYKVGTKKVAIRTKLENINRGQNKRDMGISSFKEVELYFFYVGIH